MKNNQSERKKSSMPLRINKRSFFGVLSLIAQELIESISTKLNESFFAKLLPMVDLPTPIIPVKTRLFFN